MNYYQNMYAIDQPLMPVADKVKFAKNTPSTKARNAVACALLAAVLLMAACGSQLSPGSKANYLASGQIPASDLPKVGGSANSARGSLTGATIPLAKQNPLTELFSAMSVFQSCLQALGVKFIGAPDPNNPNSPTNDPNYVKNLTTCASQSNILQALKDEQNSQNNLTPAQIKTQNANFLKWRLCMIGKGWTIPVPKPDSNGLLFAIGSGGGNEPQMTPPPGESILSSGDMEACASQVAPKGG